MGKTKKNKSKQATSAAATQSPKKQLEVQPPKDPEPELSPEEKAENYREELVRVLTEFKENFGAIDDLVTKPVEIEKNKMMDRREKDEMKKFEKIYKREQ